MAKDVWDYIGNAEGVWSTTGIPTPKLGKLAAALLGGLFAGLSYIVIGTQHAVESVISGGIVGLGEWLRSVVTGVLGYPQQYLETAFQTAANSLSGPTAFIVAFVLVAVFALVLDWFARRVL